MPWHNLNFQNIYTIEDVYVCLVTSVISDSLQPHGLQPTRLLCLWDSPGKNTGVSCHFLVQGIFATQGLLPRLQLCPGSLPLATCRPLQDTRAYSGHQHGLGPALARNSTAVYETHRPTLQIPCPLYPVFFFFSIALTRIWQIQLWLVCVGATHLSPVDHRRWILCTTVAEAPPQASSPSAFSKDVSARL